MPSRSTAAAVDTRVDASLSFAPLDRPAEREQLADARQLTAPDTKVGRESDQRTRRRRPRLVVEGVRPTAAGPIRASTGGHLGVMSEYPVQSSKVQAPPLRDETLARDRLLDWLSVKIHRRAVLLIAEAGYGKTTLLADFSRRTRVRVLWFRLDRGDRDWVGFLAYLVAAVRIHVPDFGPSTSALLRETATTAPPLDTVLDTFLRELGALPTDPMALVFDDFHLVDDSPDVRHILRELLARGPERLSLVFASRREPPIRLARLRALGEVAELSTDDLRFDAAETERLFRETYAMRLEPAVLAELSRRTEGWAASLQLVRAALHERNPAQVRAFISSLSGAEGHLYEYLAEEVVGDLPRDLQQFLMRTSLLDTVDLVLGPVAADVSEDEARRLIEEGERNGLFGRHDPTTRHRIRAHPLVRDFLQARLARAVGDDGVRAIHLRVANAAEGLSWQVSSRHYIAAGHADDARRTLESSIEHVLASGAYEAADEIAGMLEGGLSGVAGLVLQSRIAQQRALVEEGLRLAEAAYRLDASSRVALLNLASARTLAGDAAGAVVASRLLEGSSTDHLADMARVYRRAIETSVDGSLEIATDELQQLATRLRKQGAGNHLGISLTNLAYVDIAAGRVEAARDHSAEAIGLLSASSAGVELISARLAHANALALLGEIELARTEIETALAVAQAGQLVEVALEAGHIEALLGDASRGWQLINRVSDQVSPGNDHGEQALFTRALLRVQSGDHTGAVDDLSLIRRRIPRPFVAFEARCLLLEGLARWLCAEADGVRLIAEGAELAERQGARLWADYGTLLRAFTAPTDVSPSVESLAPQTVGLSLLAELVVRRLSELSPAAAERVAAEATARSGRWLGPVRRVVDRGPDTERGPAAVLLERIGESEDVLRLRAASRTLAGRQGQKLSKQLARRLAPRVLVEDLGRVRIQVGSRSVEGTEARRKVLALLCYLLTKGGFAATREEVVESLWPDLDPGAALNSLNQTVYFLRRLFEPDYLDETSPGYVAQDGESIWLDNELVDATSRRCIELIRSMPGAPTPDGTLVLATEYRGRFAMDFAYEDWAGPFRDSLHAAYLRVIEHAVRIDIDSGHFGRGTFIAERSAEIDPDVEEIQVALVRLYRLSGAHAAAAEQYGRYATAMRDLGVEPTAYADL